MRAGWAPLERKQASEGQREKFFQHPRGNLTLSPQHLEQQAAVLKTRSQISILTLLIPARYAAHTFLVVLTCAAGGA